MQWLVSRGTWWWAAVASEGETRSGSASLSHHLTLAGNVPKATTHVTFGAVASHVALQVAPVACSIRFTLRALPRDMPRSAAHITSLLILLLSSNGALPRDVTNFATDIALCIAVLALIFSALSGDVPALVAHVTGALRLWTIPGDVAHLGAVVA